MNATPKKPLPVLARDPDIAAEQVIELIDDLIEVLTQENRVLARGIPASLSRSVERKNEIADQFELWVKEVAAGNLCVRISDPAIRKQLLARIGVLRAASNENLERLRAAMDASRRRIEAVMRAIRTEMGAKASYGANGRMTGTGASIRNSVRA